MKNHKKYISTSNSRHCLSRRNFLKSTSIAIAGVSLLTGNFYTGAGNLVADSHLSLTTKHLNSFEYQVLNHLMKIALPVDTTPLPTPDEVSAMATLDQALLGGMPPHILQELKQGIQFFDEGPRKDFDNLTFRQLSASQAIQFCDSWANSNTAAERSIVMELKKLVGLAYWSNPATWPLLGYLGPISKRKGIPALGNTPLPV